ncbi:MAG: AI-2E family transporter [Mesorhizobium sp.]|nr:MAG: AI-2E family transporter [Mesorhizobium sp.]
MLRSSEFVLSLFLSAGQNAAAFLINFFLMLYLLFFILRDGEDMYRQVFRAVPLPTNQKQLLFKKFADVSIATLKGTFIVGLVQGALGGLIFAVLGINGAVFWGAVMAMVSVLPAVGTALIWVPAAVILIVGGAWIKGLILLAFRTFVISMSDNVLRPMVVGRQTKMPDYLVLFSTLGGLSLASAASSWDLWSPRCFWRFGNSLRKTIPKNDRRRTPVRLGLRPESSVEGAIPANPQ